MLLTIESSSEAGAQACDYKGDRLGVRFLLYIKYFHILHFGNKAKTLSSAPQHTMPRKF